MNALVDFVYWWWVNEQFCTLWYNDQGITCLCQSAHLTESDIYCFGLVFPAVHTLCLPPLFSLCQTSAVSCTGHFTCFHSNVSPWLWTVHGWQGRSCTPTQHMLSFLKTHHTAAIAVNQECGRKPVALWAFTCRHSIFVMCSFCSNTKYLELSIEANFNLVDVYQQPSACFLFPTCCNALVVVFMQLHRAAV